MRWPARSLLPVFLFASSHCLLISLVFCRYLLVTFSVSLSFSLSVFLLSLSILILPVVLCFFPSLFSLYMCFPFSLSLSSSFSLPLFFSHSHTHTDTRTPSQFPPMAAGSSLGVGCGSCRRSPDWLLPQAAAPHAGCTCSLDGGVMKQAQVLAPHRLSPSTYH